MQREEQVWRTSWKPSPSCAIRREPELLSAALLATLSPAHADRYMAASLAADASFTARARQRCRSFSGWFRAGGAAPPGAARSPAIGVDHRAPRFHRWHVETQESPRSCAGSGPTTRRA